MASDETLQVKQGHSGDAVRDDESSSLARTPLHDTPWLDQGRSLLDCLQTGWVRAAIALGIFTLVAILLAHQLEEVTWHDVRAALANITWSQILIAAVATAISYGALAGYDFLALRHLKVQVPGWLIALTSFVSQTFTFNLGFGVLTGGAVRLRLYGSAGLTTEQILATSLLASAGFWLGLLVALGLSLVAAPGYAASVLKISTQTATIIGASFLAIVAIWIFQRRTSSAATEGNALPNAPMTAAAIGLGALDVVASSLALYALMPASVDLPFATFLVLFTAATTLGVLSHVPGGVGVFEGTILLALPTSDHGPVLAALLAFRIIYYVLPMAIAAAAFAIFELRHKRRELTRGVFAVGDAIAPLIPTVAAIMVFLGGFVLLVSGALPAEHDRISALRHWIPLPFVEASHFVASIIGALLLIIAHGLARRLESAWRAAIALLSVGALFSIVKGFDFEEASICLFVITLLVASRHRFYRQGGIFSRPPSAPELLAIGITVGISLWIGFLTYRGVSYSEALWWDFSYRGDAPRFLRASLGVAITALLLIAYELLHRPAQFNDSIEASDTLRAQAVANTSERTDAQLALLGDKRFMFAKNDDGFVMYGVQGWSWVSMGDPVATSTEVTGELVWQFKELVDLHNGVPVFYHVTDQHLPAYLDAGFSLVKLGEEACVDLQKFTLAGGAGRKLRQLKAKAERSGAVLEIVPREQAAPFMGELKVVSDAWLAARHQSEKGFSLGFWSLPYLEHYDLAVIRHEGRVVAFANIWRGAGNHEYSIDLMRSVPDAPAGVMDLLFISLMERAKADNFRWFNLGMAPLSGLPQHRLAPLWMRAAHLVFRHGDRFYNFEGLRSYKEKFQPIWRPKYLAYPGGLRLPQVLIDVTRLIAASPQRAGEA